MSALTPTQDSMVYQFAAEMMAAATSDADTARIDRALDLVKTVQPLSYAPSVYLVCSASEADRAYTVRNNLCNCADTPRERGARHCKHEYAVQLFNRLERAEVDAEQLTVRVDPEDSIIDLWPLDGESVDLPAQCSRCHAEPICHHHRDRLGAACISRELFGEEV